MKNPLEAENTSQFLLLAFGERMLLDLLEDSNVPLGLNRRESWYAVPLERCRLLHHAAREQAALSGLNFKTELRNLLDKEGRTVQVGKKSRRDPLDPRGRDSPLPPTQTEELDLDALIAQAPLEGARRRFR